MPAIRARTSPPPAKRLPETTRSWKKTLEALEAYGCTSPLNRMELNGTKVGVISASIAYEYAKDAFPADTSFLKLGLTNPLPMDLIRSFAEKVEKLYIIEELDDFMGIPDPRGRYRL